MIRDVQRTAEGTTYVLRPLAPEDTDESLTASGRYFNPTTNTWEFPRGLEDVDVQGGVERLPMVRPAGSGGPLEQAGAAVAGAYRSNPITRQFLNLSSGAARGVQRVAGGAYGLLGQAADRLGLDGIGNAMINQADAYQARANEMNAPARADNLLLNQTGQFVGEVAATAPVVGAAGQGLRVVGQGVGQFAPRVGASITRVGQALPAAGILPRAAPVGAAAPSRLAQAGYLAENMAAGTLAGAGQAALVGQDANTGAIVGAALPVVARPLAAVGGAILGQGQKIFDPTGYGTRNAANVVRRAIGPEDYDAALAALRNAPEGVTAQQVLASTGLPVDVFMALGDIGVQANPRVFRLLFDAQEAARQGRLTRAQGAVQAAETAGAANLARAQQQQFRTTQAGEQLIGEAQGAARAVPREGAAALEDLRVGAEEAAGFYAAGRAQAQRAIDEMAGGSNLTAARTSEAAAKQALRDATAPMREELLAAADASGALTVAPISARLMQMANEPGVSLINQPVLARIAAQLDALAKRRGGVASAEDIYAFRKDLNALVAKALNEGGGDMPSSAAQRAEVVRDTQLLIDKQLEDAIREAGGPEWQSYLDTYSAGMRALERQEMMGVAGWMLRQNPAQFSNLLRGESPDTVAGIFGRGRIDLADTLEPDQLAALKNAASVLDQEADVAARFAGQTAETSRATARAKTEADIALEAARARAAQEAAAVNAMAGDVEAQNAMALARAQGDLSAVQGVNEAELARDQRVRMMAAQGGAAARDLLNPRRPLFGRARVAAAVSGSAPAGAMIMASELVDAKVSQQTRQALARAYASGASMADLIAMTPVNERGIISQILANPQFWGAAARGAVPAAAGVINSMANPSANAMSPASQ